LRILVTGGAGFIGSHLVDALVLKGHDVAIVDNLSTGNESFINNSARFYKASVTEVDALEKIFATERPQIVSHHAAQKDVRYSMAHPSEDALINVVGSINVFDLAKTYGCQNLIFASTSAVYSEPKYLPMDELHPTRPQSGYGMAKLASEGYLKLYGDVNGLRHTIFRYGNVYGPRQDPAGEAGVVAIFADQMLNSHQSTIYGNGSKTRDYIFVSDVVDANLAAIETLSNNHTFNIARGIEIQDQEIFNMVQMAVGSNSKPLYQPKRPGEAERVSLDTNLAARVLEWAPTVEPANGVVRTVEYFKTVATQG
tara:strand:- start:2294 stop:3226 length:933 start_codon:yes stop_codon:yes gene_type:complete